MKEAIMSYLKGSMLKMEEFKKKQEDFQKTIIGSPSEAELNRNKMYLFAISKISEKQRVLLFEKLPKADNTKKIITHSRSIYYLKLDDDVTDGNYQSDYYFTIKGIPIEQTLKNHKNILDFCGRIKIDSRFELEFHSIKYDENNQPYKSIEQLQKVTRYLVTKNGGTIYKKNKDGKLTGINVGYMMNIYNVNDKIIDDFDIDYSFYIRECNKIINSVYDGSLTLF